MRVKTATSEPTAFFPWKSVSAGALVRHEIVTIRIISFSLKAATVS
jgi:hypothetical protein